MMKPLLYIAMLVCFSSAACAQTLQPNCYNLLHQAALSDKRTEFVKYLNELKGTGCTAKIIAPYSKGDPPRNIISTDALAYLLIQQSIARYNSPEIIQSNACETSIIGSDVGNDHKKGGGAKFNIPSNIGSNLPMNSLSNKYHYGESSTAYGRAMTEEITSRLKTKEQPCSIKTK